MHQRVMNFIKLTNHILKYPGVYMINKVEDINIFYLGYQHALLGADGARVNSFLNSFKKFVNDYYPFEKELDWTKIIRFHAGSDKHSMELFQKIFDSYILGLSDKRTEG